MQLDLSSLPVPAQKLLGGSAPLPMRMMAAKGIVPGLKPGDLAIVIAGLTADGDDAVAATARETLGKLPPPVLQGALAADLPGPVADALVHAYRGNDEVWEGLLRQAALGADALVLMASSATERLGERIATNEQRLLAMPRVIEALYMNKRVRSSTADRIVELAVRNQVELSLPAFREMAVAIQAELIPEPTAEPTFDDLEFVETRMLAETIGDIADDEDTHDVDEEGEEQVKEKLVPLFARISTLTVTQKIRIATLGNSSERLLLVRDTNKLVATAAVKSPLLKESEAVMIAASRAVSDDVLRTIALNRELVRSYQVKLNLVSNPRTPFTFAARLIPHLRDNDLKHLSKSKNIPSAVSQGIRQQLTRKASGKG